MRKDLIWLVALLAVVALVAAGYRASRSIEVGCPGPESSPASAGPASPAAWLAVSYHPSSASNRVSWKCYLDEGGWGSLVVEEKRFVLQLPSEVMERLRDELPGVARLTPAAAMWGEERITVLVGGRTLYDGRADNPHLLPFWGTLLSSIPNPNPRKP